MLALFSKHDFNKSALHACKKMESGRHMNDIPQSKGGLARAKALTPARRKAISQRAVQARWAATKQLQDPARTPDALCQGELEVGSVTIDCYVLDNLKRVIHKRGMAKALGMKSGGGNVFLRAMNRKGLGSVLSTEVREKIDNPLVFNSLSGDPGHGYECTVLIDICDAIIGAEKDGKLGPNQGRLAVQAEIIMRAAAKLGIVALIDEATGFIADKRKEDYRELFRDFICEQFRVYKKGTGEFPDKLFDMLYKIYGLPRGKDKSKHPQFFGKFIRRYIYEPLASSRGAILEMLDEKNPVVYVNGGRRYKMYQFLSDVVGVSALQAHIWQIIGIGNSVRNKLQFERSFLIAFPAFQPQADFGWDFE